MDSTTLTLLIIFHVMAGIVIGSVFVSNGYKGDRKGHRNLTFIKTGGSLSAPLVLC